MNKQVEEDFLKIEKTIESSKTREHFKACSNMIKAFDKKWPDYQYKVLTIILYRKLLDKLEELKEQHEKRISFWNNMIKTLKNENKNI